MQMLSLLGAGFERMWDPWLLVMCFAGTFAGTLVGVLPGLGPSAAIAVLLPLTYGADPTLSARLGLDRQWLHAACLGFVHPSDGRPMSFESAPPEDLSRALDLLAEPS